MMMPGIARKTNQVSTANGVEFSRTQGHNLLSSRGAMMLLILLLLAVGLAVVQWRTSETQRMAIPTVSSYTRFYQSESLIQEDRGDIMESTQSNEPNTKVDVEVNGKSIDVPVNGGMVHKEAVSNDGTKTTVDVKFDSSTMGSSVQGQSTFKLNVQSSQVSESETQ